MGLKKIAALGALGYVYSKGPRDPRQWPAFLGEQFALLKDQAREATDAGKQASARRQAQLEREVAEAMGQTPAPPAP